MVRGLAFGTNNPIATKEVEDFILVKELGLKPKEVKELSLRKREILLTLNNTYKKIQEKIIKNGSSIRT